MNVLFVDHVCHAKTKSFDFFRNLIATRHSTDTIYFERHYHCHIPAEKLAWADVVVFLEFIPFRFACGITGKRCVYLPMYDNEWASKWHWRRLALLGMNVISFCRKVTEHAKACGVSNVLEVRFAFDPEKFAGMSGDPRIASFWDRGDISTETAKSLFEDGAVDEVMVKNGFLDDEGYRRFLSRPGVFVAPRRKEGIGMAFLEQVAMGKCVIAHDDATMNEYLEDGVTGILMDMRHPRKVSAREISAVRANMPTFAKSLYETWQRDIPRILDYFDRLVESKPLRTPWCLKSVIMYGLYWVEGGFYRLRHT